jgi:tetratricopeptide (TPR) repeat protein
MRALVCIVLVACAPYYRDLENRGRVDPKLATDSESKASHAAAEGRYAEAAQIMRDLLDAIPDSSDSTYVRWAEYATGAGQRVQARAVIRWRLGSSDSTQLRTWLVKTYVDDGWISRAIAEAGLTPENVMARLGSFPELEAALQPLPRLVVDSDNGADVRAIQRDFIKWTDDYGGSDHAVIASMTWHVRTYIANGDYGKQVDEMFERAGALSATEPLRALMLCSEATRHASPQQVATHWEACVRVARGFKDLADADPVAAQLVADGDAATNAGDLARGLRFYRRAALRVPWSADVRRRVAHVLEAMGATESAKLFAETAQQLDEAFK